MNKGTVLRYHFLNAAGSLLYEEFQNATATGGMTLPKQGSRFEAFPWRGSIGPEDLPATLEIESTQLVEGDPEYSFVVVKKPRSKYNLGGRTFESAHVVESLPSSYYGSLRSAETHGQYFKIHLDGNQSLYASGYAEVPEPLYSPNYQVAIYDESHQKIQDLINISISGIVPYLSQAFINPSSTPADFYINVTATAWNVPDFKLTLSVAALSPDEPLIFIPGIAGSYLVDNSDKLHPVELWPGLGASHDALTLNPPNPNIIATDAIRTYQITLPIIGTIYTTDVYETLLQTLKSQGPGGYREYLVKNDPALRTPTGCDLYQRPSEPNLFVFAYDWRKSNATNALLLQDYVGCVQRFHPGLKVNILAHSQGGLIARRYIVDNPGKVNRLITIATPWLGAPKAIYALETGEADFSWLLIHSKTLQRLMEFFPSTHELLPSRWYFDLGGRPFREVGDFDGNGVSNETYTFCQLSTLLNKRHKDSKPAKAGSIFHEYPGQDNWKEDQTGVDYHIFYGQQNRNTTIGQVIAENKVACAGFPPICRPRETFNVAYMPGDGTVPVRSAWRIENGENLAPTAYKWKVPSYSEATDNQAQHNGLTKTQSVRDKILYLLGHGPDPNWIDTAEVTPGPSYYMNITGVDFVSVSDEVGNNNAPLDDTFALAVPGMTYDVIGEQSIAISLSPSKTYTIKFQNGPDPITFEVVKGVDKSAATEAVRYQDLNLPASVNAMLQTSPEGISDLRYDSDGNGSFDTVVEPTAHLTGSSAQDMDPPNVMIETTKQQNNHLVTITADRTDCCGDALSNFYVFVSDEPFVSIDLSTTQIKPEYGAVTSRDK